MTALATRPRTASARRTADTLLHGPAHSPAVLPRGEEIARRARTEQGREELRRVRSLAAVIAVACVEVETAAVPCGTSPPGSRPRSWTS